MSLGKRINQYRMEHSMSQGDLAERLGVSRQSISKWETDSSVPDLDKLVKLSEIFGVTLDELVMGEREQQPAPVVPSVQSQQVVVIQQEPTPKRVTAAWVFFGLAALIFLGIALAVGSLGGIFFALPFIVLGIICLVVKKYTGLTVAWAFYLMLDAFFLFATGIRWSLVKMTFQYEASMNYLRLAFAWGLVFVMLALMGYTIWTFRKIPFERNRKNMFLLLLGWGLYLLLKLPIPVEWYYVSMLVYYLSNLREWIRFGLLTALLSRSIAFVRGRNT